MESTLTDTLSSDPFGAVRSACAWVAERARFVRIDRDRLVRYARELPIDEVESAASTELPTGTDEAEARAAFALTLGTVNFGSGYFPQLEKPTGMSGYRTIEAALRRRFESAGVITAEELRGLDACACADLFGQDLASAPRAELMELYASALQALGSLVTARFGGSFAKLVDAAGASAAVLARSLLEMPMFRDISDYDGRSVPFLKRAQLTVADLHSSGFHFRDIDELTIFADNLVAHVLRVDRVLDYDTCLSERIERRELIAARSTEEIEIRACEIHAAELICGELREQGIELPPRKLDFWLWTRGAGRKYKAKPRHRTRCWFY